MPSQESAAQEPLGSAADEAVRLVGALRDLVSGPGAEHLATGSSECQVCPVCRAISLLRDADPQTVGRAAESVVTLATTAAALAEPFLRSFVDTAISTAQAAAASAGGATASEPAPGPSATDDAPEETS